MEVASRWIVVEEGPNPSTDYFVIPYLRKLGVNIKRLTFNELPSEGELKGVQLIFVRYISRSWQSLIQQNLSKLSGVSVFLDDDLLDWSAFARMPVRYQSKILRYSWSKQRWLKSIGAKLLVSTPFLQNKYRDWSPELLSAEPLDLDKGQQLSIFYHGSASHYEDINWLYPIIKEVMAENPDLSFEIIGDKHVNRLFSGVPRVRVLYPMKWPTYLSLLRRPGRSIGLAPLLDSPFNRARSHTKFYDITQAGAVGIYAEGAIYGKVVRHQENGILLPMEPSLWIEGILQLAADDALRGKLLSEAKKCL
ncbi:glycosyltransferase family 1 protein [Microbulbifer variabilis]|uniref:Glycosyltransferase family 1 protein n=1 Tax=Microbulbifer variabilis TaxID=266805 RepID=A0ABY4VHU4_9GAMM|nr:glycosyltransferase family 1 protein [Microbulbifer variabilis]USD22395.1 glycosyltransferase family 1 protein [Microbulbifer variabilis]